MESAPALRLGGVGLEDSFGLAPLEAPFPLEAAKLSNWAPDTAGAAAGMCVVWTC